MLPTLFASRLSRRHVLAVGEGRSPAEAMTNVRFDPYDRFGCDAADGRCAPKVTCSHPMLG